MPIEKIAIEKFLSLAKQFPVIDVRSPGEYGHAHIPGSHNLPLFSNEERKIVGTAYKQESREKAIKIGLDFFGPKMRPMIEEVESVCQDKSPAEASPQTHPTGHSGTKIILIYCWRGGMRSAGVAWLMDLYGFKVYTLAGGYKKFRRHVLDTFNCNFHFNVIGGYTGSGKTALLKLLQQKNVPVLDLEHIAGHKGSAFGNIGMPKQPTQEMFENLLALELQRLLPVKEEHDSPAPLYNGPIWTEDESQRIGDINLPGQVWKTIRSSPIYFLNVPFEERLKYIVEEYGMLDKEKLINSIDRIKQRLGSLEAKNATNFLVEDNVHESFRILLKYYDKWYLKSLHNRENLNSLLTEISCKSMDIQDAHILLQQALTT